MSAPDTAPDGRPVVPMPPDYVDPLPPSLVRRPGLLGWAADQLAQPLPNGDIVKVRLVSGLDERPKVTGWPESSPPLELDDLRRAAQLMEDRPDELDRHHFSREIARNVVGGLTDVIDQAFLRLQPGQRLCVHGPEVTSDDLHHDFLVADAFRVTYRVKMHSLSPDQRCERGSGGRTEYGPKP